MIIYIVISTGTAFQTKAFSTWITYSPESSALDTKKSSTSSVFKSTSSQPSTPRPIYSELITVQLPLQIENTSALALEAYRRGLIKTVSVTVIYPTI